MPSAERPHVLVVDDEPSFAATMVDVLRARGYEAESVGTGREAEAALDRGRYDLALIDLKLPDTTGIELLARIRRSSPAPEVIVVTGNGTVENAVRALDRGAFGFLEKPPNVERLLLLVERALSRRALADSSGLLNRGIQQSRLPVFTFDLDSGAITSFNRALADAPAGARRLAGLADLLSDHDSLADHLAQLRTAGHATTEVAAGARWFQLHSQVLPGSAQTALAVLVDITPVRQREHENACSAQYFEAIFTNLAAGVLIIDADYSIARANASFCHSLGLTPSSVEGRKCHDVIHRRATPCFNHGEVCPIKNCLATGTSSRVAHRHCNAAGQEQFIEVTAAPLRDQSGAVTSFVSIFADFTEIKTAQEESEGKSRQLEKLNFELTEQQARIQAQADELRKANVELIRLGNAKSEFVSMVSHELRTPLTAINEGISLVADGTLGPVNEKQARFLTMVKNNTRRLTDLINDLLDLSRIESGRMELRAAPLDLGRLLPDAIAGFQPLARQKGLTLETRLADLPLVAYADERMLRRIMNNLLSNSLKFTDAGAVTVSCQAVPDSVVISVADSGIGIPAAEQPRLFEKFFQVHHHDGRRPPGTGLGLVLTREMVEMNSGRIWFESTEGKGSVFSFTLPLDRPTARLAALLGRMKRSGGGAPLLVGVKVTNGDSIARELGPDGLSSVLKTIEQFAMDSGLPANCSTTLKDQGLFLALASDVRPDPVSFLGRFRELLAGATFVSEGRVAGVELSIEHCTIPAEPDPARLLAQLRGI